MYHPLVFFKLRYSCCTILFKFQVYNILICNFQLSIDFWQRCIDNSVENSLLNQRCWKSWISIWKIKCLNPYLTFSTTNHSREIIHLNISYEYWENSHDSVSWSQRSARAGSSEEKVRGHQVASAKLAEAGAELVTVTEAGIGDEAEN